MALGNSANKQLLMIPMWDSCSSTREAWGIVSRVKTESKVFVNPSFDGSDDLLGSTEVVIASVFTITYRPRVFVRYDMSRSEVIVTLLPESQQVE